MADDLLSDIIHLENEIQQQLKAEQERSQAWLQRVLAEEERRLAVAGRQQQEAEREVIEAATRRATEEAAAIEAKAAEYCRLLNTVEEQELVALLERHLQHLLPG